MILLELLMSIRKHLPFDILLPLTPLKKQFLYKVGNLEF